MNLCQLLISVNHWYIWDSYIQLWICDFHSWKWKPLILTISVCFFKFLNEQPPFFTICGSLWACWRNHLPLFETEIFYTSQTITQLTSCKPSWKEKKVSKSTYTQELLHWKNSPFNFRKLFWFHQASEIMPMVLCNFSMYHIRELIISEWTNLSVIFVTAGKTEIGL